VAQLWAEPPRVVEHEGVSRGWRSRLVADAAVAQLAR
jgi:hypothetical protein